MKWKCRHCNDDLKSSKVLLDIPSSEKVAVGQNESHRIDAPPSAKSLNANNYSLGFVTRNNLGLVKVLHDACFPYTLGDRFYAMIQEHCELCRIGGCTAKRNNAVFINMLVFLLAYLNDIPVGVVCCALDVYTPTTSNSVTQPTNERTEVEFSELENSSEVSQVIRDVDPPSEKDKKCVLKTSKTSSWDITPAHTRGPHHRFRLCVLTLAVLKRYRRTGAGKTLMEWVFNRCETLRQGKSIASDSINPASVTTQGVPLSIDYLYLHVWSVNTEAQRFYSRLGFQKTCAIPDYYRKLSPSSSIVFTKQLGA